jgi:DNA repair exonuclease SbcCD nuclease subunit
LYNILNKKVKENYMKILLFADLHMCPRASIINKWGNKYPSRLENCVMSMNWLEQLAENLNCTYIVNLGDFFDKPDLSSETITACNDIKWSTIKHYSIVGNHDASTSNLVFNSVNSLLRENHEIISEPYILSLPECDICFLPYIVECDRSALKDYFKTTDPSKPRVILSHNDISGIQLGPVMSRTGFTVEEIEENCNLFINGHLHNGQAITEKIINLGNFTGKDFGEDATKYQHCVAILDTETFTLDYLENPYAYNFYKIQINAEKDIEQLNTLKANAVVSIKCESRLVEKVRARLIELQNVIVESRIILTKQLESEQTADEVKLDLSVDHLARFIECCKTNIEDTKLLDEELTEICK